MYLIDTNILIYFFDGKMTETQKDMIEEILAESFNVSVISKIEFLGFKNYMDADEFAKAKTFISHAQIIQLTDDIIDHTITLRQTHKMKLADAIIAATALEYGLILVTRNVDDFKQPEIKIHNPFTITS